MNSIIRPSHFSLPKIDNIVIICFSLEHFFLFREKMNAGKVQSFGPVKRCHSRFPIECTLLGGMIGSPFSLMTLENAIYSGGEIFIIFGNIGWIGKSQQEIGHRITAQKGYDDTRMSIDYKSISPWIDLSPLPLQSLKSECSSHQLITVNSPYLLSQEKLTKYQNQNISLIEMECTPMSYLANIRKVTLYHYFIISDLIENNTWIPGFKSPRYKKGLCCGVDEVIQFLKSISNTLETNTSQTNTLK